MNFHGHMVGGVVAGVVAVAVGLAAGELDYVPLSVDIDWRDAATQKGAAVFVTALFMSLFPDLDTASVIQRWFYRAMFILMAVVYFNGRFDVFVLLAFLALLPAIHQHRGWTHWPLTPWLVALFFSVVHEYYRVRGFWFLDFTWSHVLTFFGKYWLFVGACILGHYTHLILDSKGVRLFRNEIGHH